MLMYDESFVNWKVLLSVVSRSTTCPVLMTVGAHG